MRSLKWKLCNFCESFWQTLLVCLFLKGKEELVARPLHTAQGEEELAETLRGEQGAVCVCSARTARSFPTISQGKSCAWTCSFCSSLGDSIPHLPNCWEPVQLHCGCEHMAIREQVWGELSDSCGSWLCTHWWTVLWQWLWNAAGDAVVPAGFPSSFSLCHGKINAVRLMTSGYELASCALGWVLELVDKLALRLPCF